MWTNMNQSRLFSGGLDLKAQEAALRSNPDVVIATPGRLIDHLHNAPSFSLASIEVCDLCCFDIEMTFRSWFSMRLTECWKRRSRSR